MIQIMNDNHRRRNMRRLLERFIGKMLIEPLLIKPRNPYTTMRKESPIYFRLMQEIRSLNTHCIRHRRTISPRAIGNICMPEKKLSLDRLSFWGPRRGTRQKLELSLLIIRQDNPFLRLCSNENIRIFELFRTKVELQKSQEF